MDTVIIIKTKLLILLWPFFVEKVGPIIGAEDLRACSVIPGIVIAADTLVPYDSVLMNHEKIHFVQAKELWYVGYYFVYVKELIRNRVTRQLSGKNAYYANPFEYEAYINQSNIHYLKTRKKHAWKQYVTSKKKKILYEHRQLYEISATDTSTFTMIPSH